MQYYSFASNINKLSTRIHFILKSSCTKLLAAKYKLGSQANVYSRYGKNLKGKDKHGFMDAIYGIKTLNFKVNQNDPLLRLFAEGTSKASLQNLVCDKCGSGYKV